MYECGNWAYEVNWKPLEDSPELQRMIDQTVDEYVSQAVGNAMRDHAEAEKHGHGWLWFIAILALILAIISMFIRGPRGYRGVQGRQGPPGARGPIGPPGKDGVCKCAGTDATLAGTGSDDDSDDETDGERPTLNEILAGLREMDQRRQRIAAAFTETQKKKGLLAEAEELLKRLKRFLGLTEETSDSSKTAENPEG